MQNKPICEHCYESFYDASTLSRHIKLKRCPVLKQGKTCKDDHNLVDKISQQFSDKNEANIILQLVHELATCRLQIQNMASTIERLEKSIVTNNNSNNHSNNHNNNTYNITINNFGQENVSHITHDDKVIWAANPSMGVVEYMKKKHFDPNVPENHNLKMANVKNKELSVYMEGQWKRTPAKPILSTMLNKTVNDLFNAASFDDMSNDVEKFYEDIDDGNENSDNYKKSLSNMYYEIANQNKKLKAKIC